MMQWIWLKILRFSYRCLDLDCSEEPMGIPGRRDPNNRCDFYSPRSPQQGNWRDCNGDGHYLCKECCYFKPEEEEDGVPEDR